MPEVGAYNLSLACNHCEDPACLKACLTRAIARRDDGIVILDGRKCVGCRYCEWSCPYGAPRYDARRRIMTKCDLCADLVDAGGRPSCVAACPMRALDSVLLEELRAKLGGTDSVFPLPVASTTRPSLLIRPGIGARPGRGRGGPALSMPRRPEMAKREWPLIGFTLLAQTGVGFFVVFTLPFVLTGDSRFARPAVLRSLALALVLLASAAALSFFHLGKPVNAWRTLGNLGDSWLSREIFFLLLTTGLLAGTFVLVWARGGSRTLVVGIVIAAALSGAALILSMANIYRLEAVPSWNNAMTVFSFFMTAALVGTLAALAARPSES